MAQTQEQSNVGKSQANSAVGKGILEAFDDRSKNDEFAPLFVESIGSSEISVIDNNNKIVENSEIKEESSAILPLNEIFKQGSEISTKTWQEMLIRQAKIEEKEDDLSKPPTKLPINLKAGGLSGGIDIFEGPPIYGENNENNNNAPLNSILGQINQKIKNENLIPPDIKNLEIDQQNLFVLVTELNRTDFMLHENILDSYRDFLLCDNFLYLMREANTSTVLTYETRVLYSSMTKKVCNFSIFFVHSSLYPSLSLPPSLSLSLSLSPSLHLSLSQTPPLALALYFCFSNSLILPFHSLSLSLSHHLSLSDPLYILLLSLFLTLCRRWL